MGYAKFKRPILSRGLRIASQTTGANSGALVHPTEALTGSSAAQTLKPHGASFLTYGTSGKANDFILPDPKRAGEVKYVFVNKATSSEELSIHLASTLRLFYGSTFNGVTIAATTVSPAGTAALTLVGVSTAQWAVNAGSTIDWDFAASTGSTSQA